MPHSYESDSSAGIVELTDSDLSVTSGGCGGQRGRNRGRGNNQGAGNRRGNGAGNRRRGNGQAANAQAKALLDDLGFFGF